MTIPKRATGIRKPQTAISVVIQYAKLVKGHAFSPEEAIAWGEELGIYLEEKRGWGSAFRAAAAQGFIRPAGLFARASSNGSKRPGWILV